MYLLPTDTKKCNHKKNNVYLNLFYSSCRRVDIYRLVKCLTCRLKISTTLRFPHSSSVNIILDLDLSQLQQLYLRIIFIFNESAIFFENKIWTNHYLRKKVPTFYFVTNILTFTYLLFQLCRKIYKEYICHLFRINQTTTKWLVS